MKIRDSSEREEINRLARRMSAVARAFRKRYPLEEAPWRAGHYLLPVWSHGRPAHKALIWYHNQGCAWARKAGCTMCNFGERDDVPLDETVVADFRRELDKLDPGTRFIHLGPGGSVLQESEIRTSLRHDLVQSLERLPFLEGVGLETRAETIREDRLENLLAVLPPHVTELALGFGLESADELILRVAVNKAEAIEDIERAIERVLKVNARTPDRHVVVDCYVLLKPPFLTEGEAIEDAIESITWAYDHGAETVSLFVNTMKRNTICAWLNARTEDDGPYRYQTPYLYSAFEVLAGLRPEHRARTGVLGFTSGNPYVGAPRACDLCWHVLHGLLSAHNYTRDTALLSAAREVRCECRTNWLKELSQPAPGPLLPRFRSYVSRMECSLGLAPDQVR